MNKAKEKRNEAVLLTSRCTCCTTLEDDEYCNALKRLGYKVVFRQNILTSTAEQTPLLADIILSGHSEKNAKMDLIISPEAPLLFSTLLTYAAGKTNFQRIFTLVQEQGEYKLTNLTKSSI